MKGSSFKVIIILTLLIVVLWVIYSNLMKDEDVNVEKVEEFMPNQAGANIQADNIRIGIIEFDNINPILSNNKNVQDISRLIFDPLFTLTEDYKLEGVLATECSKIDDITYILKLRENVKWQDGNEFDSSDVIFTIDMLKKEENNSVYKHNVKNISEIYIIDEYTLEIVINEKMPYFEYNLIFPIVSSKYFSEENFTSESKNLKPVGTGKFYISDVSNNTILLRKSVSNWNNQKIKLESINLNLYNSLSSVINSFKNGEIDIFTTSNRKIDEYLKNTSYNKQEYINRNYDYLVLNCANNVLANKEVRQAINSAINKEKIIKKVYNNKYKLSNFPLDFGSYAYDKNNTVIAYDQNTAKGLLVDNGWKYSSNKWRKTVNYRYLSIDLDLLVNKEEANMVKVSKNIKEQLEAVGIRVNIIEATTAQYNKYLNNRQYDIVLMSSNYGYSPSLNKYFCEGNLSNYNNEEINNILNELDNIIEENNIKEKYTRIAEIYNDEVPYISLYYNTNSMIFSKNLKGTITPNSYNLFYGIDGWYREYTKK